MLVASAHTVATCAQHEGREVMPEQSKKEKHQRENKDDRVLILPSPQAQVLRQG